MKSLKEIKEQIQGILKIQKITRAMQNIAASKMFVTKKRKEATACYANKVSEVLEHLLSSEHAISNLAYLKNNLDQGAGVGYLILSSDHGLCGGLNDGLFQVVLEHKKQFASKELFWSLFGNQARIFFEKQQGTIVNSIVDLGEMPNVSEVVKKGREFLKLYRDGQLSKVFIAFNHLKNLNFQPTIRQLLPFEPMKKDKQKQAEYQYEPNITQLTEELILRYLEAQIFQTVVENIASEQVARMLAMQSATDNTITMIKDLRAIYHQIRQELITTEITEIIGGSEALVGVK